MVLEMQAEYVRTKGFDLHEMEEKILIFAKGIGEITRTEAANLCQFNGPQAKRVLQKLTIKYPQFRLIGERRGSYYIWDESM